MYWFEEDGAHLETFMGWIMDEPTSSRLSRKDRTWIQEIRHDEIPARELLHPLTVMVAHFWLRTREGDAGGGFQWIAGYLTEARHRERHEAVSKYHSKVQNKAFTTDEPKSAEGESELALAQDGSSEHDMSRDDLVVVSSATAIELDVTEPTKLRNEYRAFFQSKTAGPIKEAASWCATQLLLSDPDQDSLYYERLGGNVRERQALRNGRRVL